MLPDTSVSVSVFRGTLNRIYLLITVLSNPHQISACNPTTTCTQHPKLSTAAMQGILVIFCALSCLIVLQVFNLLRLQRMKENQREAAGLPRKVRDFSMDRKFVEAAEGEVSEDGLQDKTDQNNLYFTYLL